MDNFEQEQFRKLTMKMVVKVLVDDGVMEISVGEATQSFKWLAQVVTNRRGLKTDTVVTGFRNLKGELISPVDKLFEHSLKQELTVRAECTASVQIDEYGDPVFSEWMQAAYVHSAHGSQWHDESSAWRAKLLDTVTAEMEGSADAENHVALVQIGEFTDKDLDSAFALDWSQVHVPPGMHGESVRSLFRRAYGDITRLFIYYCGYGQGTHDSCTAPQPAVSYSALVCVLVCVC